MLRTKASRPNRILVGIVLCCVALGGACASFEGLPAGFGSGGGSGTPGGASGSTGGAKGVGTGGVSGVGGGATGGAVGTDGSTGGTTGGTTGTTGGTTGRGAASTGGVTGATGAGGAQGAVMKVDLKGKKVLFVVDDPTSLSDGDMMLKSIMEISRDMVVTMGDTVTANPDVAGMHLIVASSGASSSEFPALYKTAAIPMIIFSNGAYQAMGFIAASSGKGSVSTPVTATIVDATTPLASGISMGTNFSAIGTSRSTSVYWGTPGGSPLKVAAVVGSPTQLISFAYDKGATMATGTAPARRVGLGFKTDVIGDLSIESTKLLNAALEWTAGAPP